MSASETLRSTTVVAVRRGSRVAMAGDGQVTVGSTILKQGAVKIRRLHEGRVLAGFAGAAADSLTLLETFEAKLKAYGGNVLRSSVELAKAWRTERALRRLEAQLVVAGSGHLLLVSGNGDVLEPDDPVLAIGSGGPYALAAARALLSHTTLEAKDIVQEALKIAASICVYTNDHMVIDEIEL